MVDVDHITLLLTNSTDWILFLAMLKFQIQIFIPLALSTVELSWIELMIDGSWGLAEHGKFGQAILLIF